MIENVVIDAPFRWKTVVDSSNQSVVHVVPFYAGIYRPHEVSGIGCWCEIIVSVPCPRCFPDQVEEFCPLCAGEGWVKSRENIYPANHQPRRD